MAGLTYDAVNSGAGAELCLKVIEDWFNARCARDWIHAVDFNLTATDNAGWLATFELYTTEAEAKSILASSLHRNDVDTSVHNGYIRIYSESLPRCLDACASMIVGAEQSLVQSREDLASRKYPSTRTLIGLIDNGEHRRLCNEGEIGKVDVEISNALRDLGQTDCVNILSDEAFDFDLDAEHPREPYAKTLILIRTFPIKPVDLPCPRSGLAVYEQREDHFVLASSACTFHEDGKIAIKSACDELGNDGVYYSLIIRDILSSQFVNIPLHEASAL